MFPPPVVFPATREVMEGYKTVSILHFYPYFTKMHPRTQHTTCTWSSSSLGSKPIQYSIIGLFPWAPPAHIGLTLQQYYILFLNQKHSISPLTNISAARPSCSLVLQDPAAGPLQSPVSVNTRLRPLIGHQPSSLGQNTFDHPLRKVWEHRGKRFFQEMRGYHISWPIDIW